MVRVKINCQNITAKRLDETTPGSKNLNIITLGYKNFFYMNAFVYYTFSPRKKLYSQKNQIRIGKLFRLFIMNSNFFALPFGLEVSNTPKTVKVLGSNMTGICFFFCSNGKYCVSKKLSANYLSAYILSAKLPLIEFSALRNLQCVCF